MPHETPANPSVADLNAAFRKNLKRVLHTPGVAALLDVDGFIAAIRGFDDFTPENDSWGEGDFGAIDWLGERTFWKIDYYDPTMQYWCDPLDPDCQRVLTVMLADEY